MVVDSGTIFAKFESQVKTYTISKKDRYFLNILYIFFGLGYFLSNYYQRKYDEGIEGLKARVDYDQLTAPEFSTAKIFFDTLNMNYPQSMIDRIGKQFDREYHNKNEIKLIINGSDHSRKSFREVFNILRLALYGATDTELTKIIYHLLAEEYHPLELDGELKNRFQDIDQNKVLCDIGTIRNSTSENLDTTVEVDTSKMTLRVKKPWAIRDISQDNLPGERVDVTTDFKLVDKTFEWNASPVRPFELPPIQSQDIGQSSLQKESYHFGVSILAGLLIGISYYLLAYS